MTDRPKARSGQIADTASGRKPVHSRQALPIGVAAMSPFLC